MRLPRIVPLPASFRDTNPYVVGIASVLAIGAFVGFAFMVGLLRLFEDTYTIRAEFPDAAGMRTGDEVRVAGVKAGRVTKLDVDRDNGLVVVEMAVSSGVEVSQDATAEIALGTLLGAKYVRLGGPADGPFLEDIPEDERLIPLERTKSPFDIFELTRIGTRSIQATDNEKLNTFINDLADVTEGRHESIAELVTGLDRVATALNDREAQLRSLIDEADELSTTLAEKDQTLVALVDQSRAILSLLADRREALQASLRGGNSAVTELARLLTENEARLQAILDSLSPTLALLDERQSDLNGVLTFAGPAQLLQARTGSNGPWADVYIRALGPDVIAVIEEALGSERGAP